jgi:hypothetical protein
VTKSRVSAVPPNAKLLPRSEEYTVAKTVASVNWSRENQVNPFSSHPLDCWKYWITAYGKSLKALELEPLSLLLRLISNTDI